MDTASANEITDAGFAAGPARPNRTLFALLFVIPLVFTLAYGGTDTSALTHLGLLIGALVLIWTVRSYRSRTIEIALDPVQLPLIGLFVLGMIQLLPLGDPGIAGDMLGVPASGALTLDPFSTKVFLIRQAGYILFFAAALTFINTNERYRKAASAIAILGGSIAFVGILQKLASPDAIYGVRKTTQSIPFGPYFNQHHFASLMVMLSGVCISHIFGDAVSKQTKLLLGISAMLMGIAVPLTSSRGGILSYAVMLSVVAVVHFFRPGSAAKKFRLAPAAAALSALIVLGLAAVLFLGGADPLLRGIGFQNTSDDLSSGRLHFWSVAWQIFTANPIIGAGLDAFGVAFTQFDTRNGLYRVEQAHNEYLQMLADGGIVAFALVVAFIFLFVREGIRRIGDAVDPFQRVTVAGALAGCTGIFVHSLVDFPLRTAGNAFFFLLVASLAVVKIPKAIRRGTSGRER